MTIQEAWSRETSSDPERWTPENPAWGQCAVTALIIQDFFGGGLMRVEVSDLIQFKVLSHYYNILPGDRVFDLTLDQFGSSSDFVWSIHPAEERTREYVLSYPATRDRYQLLRARMGLGDVVVRDGERWILKDDKTGFLRLLDIAPNLEKAAMMQERMGL